MSYFVSVDSRIMDKVEFRYDLRWPVIMDRFSAKQFSLEDCQMMFLEITSTILDRRRNLGQKLSGEEEEYLRYR